MTGSSRCTYLKKGTVIVGSIDSYSLFPLTQQVSSAATLEPCVQGIFIELIFEVLYSSPSIIRMIKSRRVRWALHVARMVGRGMLIGYWWESQK
jgi:hypothetical protein